MSNRKKLNEIQIARAFAIIAVLSVHGFSSAITNLDNSSILYPIYNLLNSAGKLGTPTFIMLSSFILFYTYYQYPLNGQFIWRFFKKRIKFILVPYIFFSLFYFFFKWYYLDEVYYTSFSEVLEKLQFYLLYGKAHPHLYFVIISIQFYIFFPLMLWIMKKSNFVRKYAIIIGIVIQAIWIYTNRHYFQVEFKGSVALSYTAFYFLGAYLGLHYEQIKEKMNNVTNYRDKMIAFISIGTGISAVLYIGYFYLTRIQVWPAISAKLPDYITTNFYEFSWGFYAIFAAIAILMLSNYIAYSNHEKLKRRLVNLGSLSFGIYLIHPLFLLVLRNIFVSSNSVMFHLNQIIIISITFILSYYTVYFTYKYIPFSWIIFGKSDKKQ